MHARKSTWLTCGLIAVALSSLTTRATAADQRPNIVLLVVDDQRWDSLGCMGNKIVQTPNIDSLARRGVLFENFFCTTSICATSRATIISGQYARRHGIWDFRTMFSPEEFAATFPALLKVNGYRTGFVGKWGIGPARDLPADRYDFWDGFPGQGRYYTPGDEEHLTRKLSASTMKFLDGCTSEQPFCLQLSFKSAHCQDGADWQFQHDMRYKDLYADVEIPALPTATEEHFGRLPDFLQASEARVRWKVRFDGDEMFQDSVKDYYRLISGVDAVVGEINARLRDRGLADNTVIIYTSENGFYLGDHGLAGKWFMHEPSIRLPLIVYDPRQPESRRGERIDALTLTVDIAPTILAAAGVESPAGMQGMDLAPLVADGEPAAWRKDFLYEHLFAHPRIPKNEGVRGERWKYVRYPDFEPMYEELYDLQSDPLEERNLAGDWKQQPQLHRMRERFVQLASNAEEGQPDQKEIKLNYPKTRRSDQQDDYHGTAVADPYRWLEDVDSDETKAWVEAQNKVTFGYLEQLPQREKFKQRLTELWNYERFGLPRKKGGRYFYSRNNGLQNQSVLYVADSLDSDPRVLLDPNKLSDDGTVALANWRVSDSGKLLAYGLAADGSDWREWKVRDVDTGEDLSDHLKWVKFSGVSWTPDNEGFFYSRYDEPTEGKQFTGVNYFQKLYYHRIGDPQSKDELVYERQDEKEWGFDGEVTEDGHYLIVTVWRGTEEKHQVFYKDLTDDKAQMVELLTGFDAEYAFVGNEGETFYFFTDLDAPLKRIVAIDIKSPQRDAWREIIPETQDTLRGAGLLGGRMVASYLKDASSLIRVFDTSGKQVRDVELPAIGSAGGFGGRFDDTETFYSFSNFTTPSTIYRYDVATGESTVFRSPQVEFDPADYVTRQVFYKSKDGTKVPMFITHRKGLKLTGDNPTLLYAYGGFNIAITPGFSVSNLVWLEAGGVYAVPNLRGGGEYGRAWHEAGMLDKKQNVFDDYIAAAEWLIENKYTSRDKLGIHGRSNGGLLVGAAMSQRPELFAAALPGVGVMDMLRYHTFTIGWAWVSEYGSSADADQFKTLRAYSPLHNLTEGASYPATMVTTADHDDRVVPGHSFKFAAQLQHAHQGDAPVLIRIETSAGHGAGTPTAKLIDEAADKLAFLSEQLNAAP